MRFGFITGLILLLIMPKVIRYIGTIDDNYQDPEAVQQTYLTDALDAVLAGNDPEPDFTKAIGCTIKVKK